MKKDNEYKSGIYGKAEVRFGGKIQLGIAQFGGGIHGITMSEFFDNGKVGEENPSQDHHDPQVFLLFNNIKSVEMLEQCLMSVREYLKQDVEKARADKGREVMQ